MVTAGDQIDVVVELSISRDLALLEMFKFRDDFRLAQSVRAAALR